VVELLAMRLKASGYAVDFAYNGKDGLEKVQKERPALIILDVMMPEMDGFAVLRRLRGNPETRYLPVIMLTAKGDSESIFKAEGLGSTDYIVKPFVSAELASLIKKYVV
jgi:DNA-binding response OmpR family regulator